MGQLRLVFPTPEMEEAALDYKRDFMDAGEPVINGGGGLDRAADYGGWLRRITEGLTRSDENHVPATTYFAVMDGRIVGTIQIRHRLNGRLLLMSGHIGYAVRPSERRKGYAAKILALALEKCRELGIEKALITCDKGNIGSARTIVKNGGVLENELLREDGGITQRYWLAISP